MNIQHPAYVNKEMLLEALLRLGVQKGDDLYVASSMATLGYMSDPLKTVSEVLLELVGEEGTIMMPTFNFDFCNGIDFDIDKTPSTVGVLTEYFRTNYSTCRSTSPPYHSICARGKNAELVSKIKSISSFGENSFFQYLLDIDAKYLLIGVSFDAVPSFHWIEEKVQVPYRFWKNFKGNVIRQNGSQKEEYSMFARKEGFRLDLNPLAEQFARDSLMKLGSVGWCQLKLFSTQTFTDFFLPRMQEDPLLLLSSDSKDLLEQRDS